MIRENVGNVCESEKCRERRATHAHVDNVDRRAGTQDTDEKNKKRGGTWNYKR